MYAWRVVVWNLLRRNGALANEAGPVGGVTASPKETRLPVFGFWRKTYLPKIVRSPRDVEVPPVGTMPRPRRFVAVTVFSGRRGAGGPRPPSVAFPGPR